MMSELEINGGAPKKKSTFSPLELDMKDEYDSLIHETGDYSQVVSRLTLRRKAAGAASRFFPAKTRVLGLLRSTSNTSFALRNALFLAMLGGMALLFLNSIDRSVEVIEDQVKNPRGVHQNSFGGAKNIAQPGGAMVHETHNVHDLHGSEDVPQAHSSRAIPSLSQENIINHVGHYWHDFTKSPYASHFYKRNETLLGQEQEEFDKKMEQIHKEWGAWNLTDESFYDEYGTVRPQVKWDDYDYRDVPLDDFPADAWQNDEDYVGRFLNESKALIQRVKESIYEEYGHGTTENMTPEQVAQQQELFRVILDSNLLVMDGVAVDSFSQEALKGVAYLNSNAWDGLVTKLLHSVMTQDFFYVVLGGDAAAAGHGNNFLQSSIMQFHYIMEPIFDFMDVKLISRNMAMPATTTASALAGGDIYGEADIMLWHYKEEKDTPVQTKGPPDLFNKQAILAGERVPILLTPQMVNILRDSQSKAWVGNLQKGAAMCDYTTDEDGKGLPPACRGLKCDSKQAAFCKPHYNSVCWVDRNDFSPPTHQKRHVDDTDKGYPDPVSHLLEARKLTMLVLHALDAAFDKWQEGIKTDGFPLKEKYWHVGNVYKEIQENVRLAYPGGEDRSPGCEELFKDFPTVCRVAMHGYTEWTPRVTPNRTNLRSIIQNSILDETPELAYDDMDLLPQEWKVPGIDVHAIAIATTAPPPEENEFGEFEDYYDDLNDDLYMPMEHDDMDEEEDHDGHGHFRNLFMQAESSSTSIQSALDPQQLAQRTSKVSLRHTARRQDGEEIVPGLGWMLYNENTGFCDGSAQSTCKRTMDSDCLMAGHNDGTKAGLLGDALSGWLVMSVPKVKNGIVLVRFEPGVDANINEQTEGWTQVDEGNEVEDNDRRRRKMKISKDFKFDYAINGKITTLSGRDFINMGVDIADGFTVWPLLLDEEMSKKSRKSNDEGDTIEVAIRIRSADGRGATILLSHLYYA